MKKELILKKCLKCGAIVKVIRDCDCRDSHIKCCNQEMIRIIPNTCEASAEKHLPKLTSKDGKIVVTVDHVMEEDHYIEWICQVTDTKEIIKYFAPQDSAVAEFENIKDSKFYAYCNKHELWMKELD